MRRVQVLLILLCVACAAHTLGCASTGRTRGERAAIAGAVVGAVLLQGLAEAVQNDRLRKRVRYAAATYWDCEGPLSAERQYEQGDRDVLEVYGCERVAWFECGRTSCRILPGSERDATAEEIAAVARAAAKRAKRAKRTSGTKSQCARSPKGRRGACSS